MIRRRNPETLRWVGRALMTGQIPYRRTARRMAALRTVLELAPDANDAAIEIELKTFRPGNRRG